MNATPGPILPKICDWMLNKNYESHTRSQTIGNCFQFPALFRLFPSASLLVAHLGLNPVKVRVRVRGLG